MPPFPTALFIVIYPSDPPLLQCLSTFLVEPCNAPIGFNGSVTNPLLTASPLPFCLPEFEHITEADFRGAFTIGMAEQLAALDALASNPEPPTPANTLHAWERSNATLSRTQNAFWVVKSADATPERNAISRQSPLGTDPGTSPTSSAVATPRPTTPTSGAR